MQKLNKKGQTLELIGGTIVGFMVLIFMIFAVLYGITALNPGAFFSAGSANQNATNQLTSNLTTGVGNFGNYIPVIITVLSVVLVLAGIAVLILYVRRMQSTGTAGGL